MSELGALDSDGRITAEGQSLRALALPPRLARMIVDSHRLGAGEEAADIAAILTERGLGGDSVDLDAQARPVPPRPLAARQQRPQPRAALGAAGGDDGRVRLLRMISPSTGIMLALAFPDRVARNRGNGSFVLANGRGAAVEQTSSLARAPYIAVAELTGTAAQGRILLAAPIAQEEIETRFADQIEDSGRDFVRSRRDGAARRAASGRCTQSRCRKRRSRCRPRRRPRASSPRA